MTLNNDTRISVRLPKELKQMNEAVAAFEDRAPADVVRVAMKHYFHSQGYFDPDFITRLAMKGHTK